MTSNTRLTLADVETVAGQLATPRTSRWQVHVIAHVQAHRFDDESVWTYVEANVWRYVDQDYDETEKERLGSLRRDDEGITVVLIDDISGVTMDWIIALCKERGVRIGAPPTIERFLKAMDGIP